MACIGSDNSLPSIWLQDINAHSLSIGPLRTNLKLVIYENVFPTVVCEIAVLLFGIQMFEDAMIGVLHMISVLLCKKIYILDIKIAWTMKGL